jgi:nucleoside-diphosphate-sugar epimerase
MMIKITGGTGFIGGHIVEYFQEKGVPIERVTRETADLRDLPALKKALAGAGCVIHNAARARDWGAFSDFYADNALGTKNVLEACVANGVKHVILTSSCAVYGEEDFRGVKNEESPLRSHYPYFLHRLFPCAMNFYRDTKRMAKELALTYSDRLRLCFLEPVWVYGERERHTGFYEYLKMAKAKTPFICGSAKNKFHAVYARDLAKAYYLAYMKKAEGSYLIAPPEAMKMEALYADFCKAAGYKKPRNLPKWLCAPAGFLLELLWTLFRAKEPPPLTRGRVNLFYDNIEYSARKAREELGFSCDYGFEESIAKTAEWYKKEGWL